MALIINEIFSSIQGESTFAGLPFLFVRLTGCNLRCRYCDTRYAYEEGSAWEIARILQHLNQFKCRRVTVTGGEPLLQAQTPDLITALLGQAYIVTLETNGSLDISRVDPRCIKILDIKCPSSGMQAHNLEKNWSLLTNEDQVKFVVADQIDFEFARRTTAALPCHIRPGNVLFSPAHGLLAPRLLAQWMMETQVEGRLQIQLHKYIWPDIQRGV
ncbi:MAG: radical SAM protein [Desulfobacteraceae bacterium]|nr:radical SAM protein [Desulfobacteraceae bacterium]